MTSPYDRETVATKLCELAANQVDADPTQVKVDTHFRNDLGFDSLDEAEYVMTVEEAFGVDIPNEDASEIRTVQHALDALYPLLVDASQVS